MPDFPKSIPSFSTIVDGVSHPKAEHLNIPNRELEAICGVLGISPKTITTTTSTATPREQPQTVGHYLDMLAYIFKTIAGTTNWYSANVPSRSYCHGHGGGGTVGIGATWYVGPGQNIPTATESLTHIVAPFAGTITNFRALILTAQPGTGNLVFTIRINGANSALAFTLAAGTSGGTVGGNNGSIAVAAGDLLDISIQNNAASASAQIGPWSWEMDQAG